MRDFSSTAFNGDLPRTYQLKVGPIYLTLSQVLNYWRDGFLSRYVYFCIFVISLEIFQVSPKNENVQQMIGIRFYENCQSKLVAVMAMKARGVKQIAQAVHVHIGRLERDSKDLKKIKVSFKIEKPFDSLILCKFPATLASFLMWASNLLAPPGSECREKLGRRVCSIWS